MISVSYPPYPPHTHTQPDHQPKHQQQLPTQQSLFDPTYNPLAALTDNNINSINNLPATATTTTTTIDTLPADHLTMQSDGWGGTMYATQNSNKMGGRLPHQRDSSLSSLGSTGPASPFNQNQGQNGAAYYQLAKSVGAPYTGYQNLDAMPEMAYPVTIPGPNQKPRSDQPRNGLLPAPDLAGASRSHPASVASSVTGDSPATPTMNDATVENDKRRKAGYGDVPKLGRTLTDVFSDELYSPNFTITSTPPTQATIPSPNMDVFKQRLSAANTQHLTDSHSPVSSTSQNNRSSPFRTGSPHAPGLIHDMRNPMQFNAAQAMPRDQTRTNNDVAAQMFQTQATRQEPDTPKTISPKDAVLEFQEPEGEANFPLFPTDVNGFTMAGMDQLPKLPMGQVMSQTLPPQPVNYLASQMPMGMQIPQQYPFIGRQHPSHSPPRLSSAGSSSDAGSVSHLQRPAATSADGGTYTCTYHGCTLRFATPALLQKHKREGHRQVQGLGRPHEMGGMTSNMLNSQAGPHRCDRINPSTGKPCNTIFSRPYDLTRHEDTIHNARKQKVRCDLCTEEKTFSRADALTRHYRVCHPDIEPPGKHRRRAGN